MLPAAMKGLGLVLLAALLCSAPGKSGGRWRGGGGKSRSPESLCETAPERTRCGAAILL